MKRNEIPPNFFEGHLYIGVMLHDAKVQVFYLQAKYHMAGHTVSIFLHCPHFRNENYEEILSLRYINSFCITEPKENCQMWLSVQREVAAYKANNCLNSKLLNPSNMCIVKDAVLMK